MACGGCNYTFEEVILNFKGKDDAATQFFKDHGVLPLHKTCPTCNADVYINSEGLFRCQKQTTCKRRKRITRCSYKSSLYKGTWFEKVHLSPSQNLLFINIFVRKYFSQLYCEENFGLSANTIVDWKTFCGEVCQDWVQNQPAIGGPGVIVEIDESKFGKRKYHRGKSVTGIWVFGGIERESKKRFIVEVDKRDETTLLPLCLKYIKPGSIVYSDCWKAYSRLHDHGFIHHTVNHSKHFKDPVTGVHTNNIERLWKDIKSWVLRSGNRPYHYKYYFARYLFTLAHPDHRTILHHFVSQIARLYPPQQ